jgi:membrane-associated phospholipid phosphatase
VKHESKSEAEKDDSRNKFSFLKFIRFWYPMFLILYVFKESYLLVHPINSVDIDPLLIQADYLLFRTNPTQWIYQFANPLLTEFLQIIYSLYYVVIPVYGIELFLKKRYDDFNYSVFVLFAGFYLAYTFYFITPAIGPRFYLHDFYSINTELPGLWLTDLMRSFLNFGESIPAGVANPQDYVQRDAMPSLHAEIAILLAYLSKKLKLRSFYFYFPYSLLMIISTIYLRYHYVVDIAAGALAALVTVWIAKVVYGKRLKTE